MESLSELWMDACIELWELSERKPLIRSTATLWDAFRFLYMKMIPVSSRDKVDIPEE